MVGYPESRYFLNGRWQTSAVPGTILGITSYNPSQVTTANTITQMPQFSVVDQFNAIVSFVAPASGNVLVTTAVTATAAGGVGTGLALCLLEAGVVIPGTDGLTVKNPAGGPITTMIYEVDTVTGLVPGSQHTYQLGFASLTATSCSVSYGGTGTPTSIGPLVMIVAAL